MTTDANDNKPILDLTNFESIKTQITLTGSKGKALPNPDFEIKLEEYDETSMTLEVGPGTLKRGDLVQIRLEVLAPQVHQMTLEIKAKVDELTLIHKGPDKIRLSFETFNQESWDKFRKLFSNRQEEILRYFEMVKG